MIMGKTRQRKSVRNNTCNITLGEDTYVRWCHIGVAERLKTDAEVADYLIKLYDNVQKGIQSSLSTCAYCDGSLAFTCMGCGHFQIPEPPPGTSVALNDDEAPEQVEQQTVKRSPRISVKKRKFSVESSSPPQTPVPCLPENLSWNDLQPTVQLERIPVPVNHEHAAVKEGTDHMEESAPVCSHNKNDDHADVEGLPPLSDFGGLPSPSDLAADSCEPMIPDLLIDYNDSDLNLETNKDIAVTVSQPSRPPSGLGGSEINSYSAQEMSDTFPNKEADVAVSQSHVLFSQSTCTSVLQQLVSSMTRGSSVLYTNSCGMPDIVYKEAAVTVCQSSELYAQTTPVCYQAASGITTSVLGVNSACRMSDSPPNKEAAIAASQSSGLYSQSTPMPHEPASALNTSVLSFESVFGMPDNLTNKETATTVSSSLGLCTEISSVFYPSVFGQSAAVPSLNSICGMSDAPDIMVVSPEPTEISLAGKPVDHTSKTQEADQTCLNTERRTSKFPPQEELTCQICGNRFPSQSQLDEHTLKFHTDVQPADEKEMFAICDVCGDSVTRSDLTQHLAKHAQKKPPLSCTICGATLSSKQTLKNHMLKHEGIFSHICCQCGKGFYSAGTLASHMVVHRDEKPFRCSHCGDSFARKANLKAHVQRKHSSERPYKCDYCSYASVSPHDLAEHVRTHTGEKPYICKDCGASFSRVDYLKKHNAIHVGEKLVVCDNCGIGFRHELGLKRHMRLGCN